METSDPRINQALIPIDLLAAEPNAGQPATANDSCIERGATIAYNAEATAAARKDVVEFLTNLFHR